MASAPGISTPVSGRTCSVNLTMAAFIAYGYGFAHVDGVTRACEDRRSPSRMDRPVSARLKAHPCELECVVQLTWRCVSDAFKLHAGMKFIRIMLFGQLLGDVVQRGCIRRINQCSEIGIGLLLRLCPEPKSGE